MVLPPGTGPLLDRFASQIRPVAGAVALYVGGSLATGDYRAERAALGTRFHDHGSLQPIVPAKDP